MKYRVLHTLTLAGNESFRKRVLFGEGGYTATWATRESSFLPTYTLALKCRIFKTEGRFRVGLSREVIFPFEAHDMHDSEADSRSDPNEELVWLIAQAQQRLYAFLLVLVRRPADVDDILQETNVVMWRKRETYRSGTDFFAWAFEIARFQVLAFKARESRQIDPCDESLLEALAETVRVESADYDRRAAALQGCLEKLTANQRQLIVRRYQPDVAVNSLAVEMGKNAKAVSESLRRIREILRQCIQRTVAAESRT